MIVGVLNFFYNVFKILKFFKSRVFFLGHGQIVWNMHKINPIAFFSSPEHNMLKGSF